MAEARTTWGPAGGTAGVCLTCGKEARSPRAFYCEEHVPAKNHGRHAAVPRETAVSTQEPDAVTDEADGPYAERTPTEPKHAKKEKEGILGRLWVVKDKEEKTEAPRTTPERRPAVPKRRSSTEEFWGDLVAPGAAAISARAGYVPMARAIEWTSPVVGEIVEEATKGTLIDKLVQPYVRNAEKWEDLFDLIGFWGAIGMAQKNPAQAEGALNFARKRFVNLLPRIAKKIKAERAKEKAAADALIELMPDVRELFPEMADTDDPVTLLIQSLFAAPEGVPEPTYAAQ